MRYIPSLMLLTLLLIATLSINSAHSSLQEEFTVHNIGNILIQDNFAETIFFEYGAESGVLQPPWTQVNAVDRGKVEISTTYARAGNEAVRLYQPSPPKSDGERRPGVYWWDEPSWAYESYMSWWMYFPTGYDDIVAQSEWLRLGGRTLYWTKPGGSYTGLRACFFTGYDGEGFYVTMTWSKIEDDTVTFSYAGTKVRAALDTWHHFQVYLNNDDVNGHVIGWINNVVNGEWTEATDPISHGWQTGDTFIHGDDRYTYTVQQYSDYNIPSLEVWFDDVVVATEKVPDSYRVIDR